MQIVKTKYFNDHHSVCSLMIDDLVPVAITIDGNPNSSNDWGFLGGDSNSIITYFKNFFLSKYPEVKGTIFLPLNSQNNIDTNSGYKVFKKELDSDFIDQVVKILPNFEIAFHGINHTTIKNYIPQFEFEHFDINDTELFSNKIKEFESFIKTFHGVKFPGYKYNQDAIKFVQKTGFKWIALDSYMINRIKSDNSLNQIHDTKMINIPTNLSGDIFNYFTGSTSKLKNLVKKIYKKKLSGEEIIEWLYINQLPITVQEHFQNQRTDGKRQSPNIYDDILSLDRIFGILRTKDIWYANCDEIAHYYDSILNTDFVTSNDDLEIKYFGNWGSPLISIKSDFKEIIDISENRIITGIRKNGKYIYNFNKTGRYKLCL